jgi:hypothetical protein
MLLARIAFTLSHHVWIENLSPNQGLFRELRRLLPTLFTGMTESQPILSISKPEWSTSTSKSKPQAL